MMRFGTIAAAAALVAAPAFAQDAQTPDVSLVSGDPAAGEEAFNRQCATCHVVVTPDGETLAGRNAKVGPNQYGLAYDLIGNQEDFNYSDAIMQLHEAGERWTEGEVRRLRSGPDRLAPGGDGRPARARQDGLPSPLRGGRTRPLGLLHLDQPRADRGRAGGLPRREPALLIRSAPLPPTGRSGASRRPAHSTVRRIRLTIHHTASTTKGTAAAAATGSGTSAASAAGAST